MSHANEARQIRKHTAQHDLFNRLHSIAADQVFVRSIYQHYNDRFPMVGMSATFARGAVSSSYNDQRIRDADRGIAISIRARMCMGTLSQLTDIPQSAILPVVIGWQLMQA